MYRLTTVDKKLMEQEVVANAEVFANDIRATGHAAIYGIYFDTAKATIKPESARPSRKWPSCSRRMPT